MIDFHCHLDLYPNPDQVVEECKKCELYVLSVTTTPSAWNGTSSLARNAARIRTALGLHPQIAHERLGELPLFDKLLPEARYVGEIGLDGAPEFQPHWQKQITVFEHILAQCVQAGGRIMSVHSRRAAQPVLDRIKAFPGAGTTVLHWFSGSTKELKHAIELQCWFSVGPAMFNSAKGRALISQMPTNRVLTETDGPFVNVDGVPLMPWDVDSSIKELSKMWAISEDETQQALLNNLRELVSS
ncbi:MAG: TatD family hydrolase [Chloroflexota bacterium]|nr:TatD family deoxyribonuclease [Chloroflexota bacterium]NOG65404.1 TatD family hydrolase [Chloroflexota bacterium]GIK64317.1 MAG: TatD family hydrolase [Chloroflexota bacterium]